MNTKIIAILMVASVVAMAIGVPAMISAKDVDIGADVGNAAPYVCCKWEADPTDINTPVTEVTPNQNASKTVAIVACVCDPNGNGDITGVSADVTGPTGFTPVTVTLTADGTVNCGAGCSCTPAPSVSCTGYSGTFNMAPCDPAGTYTVSVTATDGELTSEPLENTFEYESMMGIDLDLAAVTFGSVAPGTSKEVLGNDTFGDALLTVKSTNNAAIDVNVTVKTTMTDGINTIPDANIGCRVDDTAYKALDTEKTYAVNLGCGVTKNVDLNLTVDSGQQAGNYKGALTFTAIAA